MTRTVLFGGSFDPPTNAHIAMGEALAARFDRVVVLPGAVSPFKPGADALDPALRLGWLRRAFAALDNVEVSDSEIVAGGISYSYLSARRFSAPNQTLYFALGSDGLPTLDRWRNIDEMKDTVLFYVVARPGFPVDPTVLARMTGQGLRIECADFAGEEGSSSLLKVAVAYGRTRTVVPDFVADEIERRGLYRKYCPIAARYREWGVKQSRIDHIYGAVKAGIILAKKQGEDVDRAVRALMWHDIGKYVSAAEARRRGVAVPSFVDDLPPKCRHAPIGAAIARLCGEQDEDVLRAVETHTTGALDMSRLQKIVYLADYIEEGRDFPGVEDIRAAVYDDLDRGMAAVLAHTVEYLSAGSGEIDPVVYRLYEQYRNLIKRKDS